MWEYDMVKVQDIHVWKCHNETSEQMYHKHMLMKTSEKQNRNAKQEEKKVKEEGRSDQERVQVVGTVIKVHYVYIKIA